MQGLLFETPNNIDYARDIIKKTIVNDPRPISIAYSGGKDSTLLLQLTLEARDLAESDKQIYVTFSNTGYECDGKLERIQSVFERLKDIPNLSAKIVSPPGIQYFSFHYWARIPRALLAVSALHV